jgi:hypothetical protein
MNAVSLHHPVLVVNSFEKKRNQNRVIPVRERLIDPGKRTGIALAVVGRHLHTHQ